MADAKKAVEYGVDGIVVSNHVGRQVDGALTSLDALEKIVAGMLNTPISYSSLCPIILSIYRP